MSATSRWSRISSSVVVYGCKNVTPPGICSACSAVQNPKPSATVSSGGSWSCSSASGGWFARHLAWPSRSSTSVSLLGIGGGFPPQAIDR